MTSLIFLAIVILGLASLSRLPIDLYPDIETNTIMVITTYSGASASDIENNVTRPLENTLNSVEHLKHITSKSRENTSIITLEFEYGNDIEVLTNDVRDKLDMISSSLPDACGTPIIFKFSTDMIPIVVLSVQAKESQSALYKILDENIVNPLARIDGVGTVSITGAPKREINIYMDPQKMEAYHIPVETVSAAIASENKNVPGGSFDVGNNTYSLRVEGEFTDPQQMQNIVVGTYNGAPVYLRDVARIVDSVQERAQKAFNNGVQGAMIVIQKQSGANSVAIATKVKQMMPELQRNLPSDVKLGVIVNTSDNILDTVHSLTETIIYALLFVVLVVFVFLGRWRATLIISLTIPMSLIASFIYLFATGSSLNMISLSCLSIAIGNVVDDAIVVLENVTTHIERGSDPKQAAVHGTNEVAVSVIASTLTMIAVFFPMTMVSGMAGVLFRELGWMMCIIMAISTFSALSFTPMLCSRMLRLQKRQSKAFKVLYSPVRHALDRLDDGYAALLNWGARHRWTVVLCCLALFLVSLLCTKGINTEYFPQADNARVGATLELPIGARVERAQAIAMDLTRRWQRRYGKDMLACNFRVGQAGDDNAYASMQDNGNNIISFTINLVPSNQRKIGLQQVCDEMRRDCRDYPDLVKTQIMMGGSHSSMGGQTMATFEVYGYDFATTDRVAADLSRRLSAVDGVSEVNISRSDYQPEYHVNFDRQKLALSGISFSTAANYLRNRINGSQASYYREDGDEYDIKVRYEPDKRTSITDLENVMLYNAAGQGVRVGDVGKVVESAAPPTIERKDRQRIVTVNAVLSGLALSEGVKAGQDIIHKMDLPAGVTVQVAGSYEDQQDAFSDLGLLLVLVLLLVFIVMAAEFESLTYPFIIMFSVVFALSGVLFALFFTDTKLNMMSLLGGIMLVGIVVKNGIVLIDYIRLCRERGQGVIKSVTTSGRSRLRPVLMTSLTTILGMVPMAIGSGVGAEMWRPLGVAIIGGLTVSTLMTLIFVPIAYSIFAAFGIAVTRRRLRRHRALNAYYQAHKDEMIHRKG
jgi:HAE1 family hydrophobic/amphiphilic exporter-1